MTVRNETMTIGVSKHAGFVLEFVKYFAASTAALGADAGVLALSSSAGFSYQVAAAAGFASGLLVAYVLSVKWVFERRSMKAPMPEFLLFSGVGVAGLGLTELILWAFIGGLGWHLAYAKIVSSACVFVFNFGIRKALLFANGKI